MRATLSRGGGAFLGSCDRVYATLGHALLSWLISIRRPGDGDGGEHGCDCSPRPRGARHAPTLHETACGPPYAYEGLPFFVTTSNFRFAFNKPLTFHEDVRPSRRFSCEHLASRRGEHNANPVSSPPPGVFVRAAYGQIWTWTIALHTRQA